MGEATARVFAAAGAHVLVSDIDAELDEQEWDRVLAVDLKGVALCLKYEVAQMLEQGDGGVDRQHRLGELVPAAAEQRGLRRGEARRDRPHQGGLARERPAGHPRQHGLSRGDRHADDPRRARDGRLDRGGVRSRVLSLFGRFGKPEEVAQASLWLCSDQSSYVTGAVLAVDAGYTSR